ncbi:hypothetical protein NDU88_005299 [Pleurodeles waltl]|uniref:Uncharacterized protein n=1 Tax=Pleurodeles waltl TaxID=8319 RepID=A0AAV7VLM7_PLEWA|nr:hypothetical protein NDU88_005299 [Pleurodeles waltl]
MVITPGAKKLRCEGPSRAESLACLQEAVQKEEWCRRRRTEGTKERRRIRRSEKAVEETGEQDSNAQVWERSGSRPLAFWPFD